MKYRRLLMSAVCLIGVFMFIGQANAIRWYGFSDLCFDATFTKDNSTKTVFLKDTKLDITLNDVTVVVQCRSTNEPIDGDLRCSPGVGNSGSYLIEASTYLSDKYKNNFIVDGCINLYEMNTLSAVTVGPSDPCHTDKNINKVEVPNSAYVPEIHVSWVLSKIDDGEEIGTGTQYCRFEAPIDQLTCLPEHDIDFECDIDLEKWINKDGELIEIVK